MGRSIMVVLSNTKKEPGGTQFVSFIFEVGETSNRREGMARKESRLRGRDEEYPNKFASGVRNYFAR
jgi:hypothetical protein